jgi:glucans biosynthesis protein C
MKEALEMRRLPIRLDGGPGPGTTGAEVGEALERDKSIDYLRASVIVMVVFLHAALAYASFITFNKTRYGESPHPVVDNILWPNLNIVISYLDTFMMPLMFFLSGFFVLAGLDRRGSRYYFIARLKRLGIPFLFGISILAPLSWWPAWKLSDHGTLPYLVTFFTSDGWPIGPPWFLWVLLLFSGIAALMYRFAFFRALFHTQPGMNSISLVTLVSYLSLSLFIPDTWISLGPFDVQLPRIALYFAYFVLGIAAGSNRQWLKDGAPRRWGRLLAFGMLSFLIYIACVGGIIKFTGVFSSIFSKLAFAGSCAGCTFGFLGAFRAWFRKPIPLFESLQADSFGIYLFHYSFVVWLQYALAAASLPVGAKFCIAFLGGLGLSWGLVALIRKIPVARKLL